ncbi:MAG TPA: zf-HC2 domain-containing protein [Ktedonobacterales bacterium]
MSARIEREGEDTPQTPDCAVCAPLLPLYALGELDPDEAEQVCAHKAGCAHCQTLLTEYGALRRGIADTYRGGRLAPFPPLTLNDIILADQLSEETRGEEMAPAARAPLGGFALGHRLASRGAGRPYALSRELTSIAAALLLALAAALIFSNLRSAATLPPGPRIIEYPALNDAGGLTGLTAGPDGNIWFTDLFSAQVGRITPTGAVTRFNLPTRNAHPEGITTGPDGALWFVEYRESSSIATGNICFDSRIGRITTSGGIRYFTIASTSCPDVITAGPDGALWFTARATDQIGRITPSGAVTIYSLPHAGSLPEGITTGPDGALWFAERGASRIGRITTSGAISEYPIAGGSALISITTGPDGALWFTETGAIGRITTNGAITRYPLPGASTTPGSITAGPDGALWFTEYSETNFVTCDGSHVGRITTSGRTSEYAVTANSCPSAITRGPNGALWFIEAARNAFGEIHPAS